MAAPARTRELVELSRLFLKLGTIGFGGPAAHIAMMEDEVVRRRRWLTREEFLDLLGATNLIPGPNSTEMAIHIGHRRAGWPGLLVAGAGFILPATLIVGAIAWAYVRFGELPNILGLLYGIKPVIIAIVLQALWSLGRTALETNPLFVIAIAAAALSFFGVNELLILFGTGLLMLIARSARRSSQSSGLLLGITPARRSERSEFFCRHFFFVAASGSLVPRLRRSPAAGAFLDGVNVASLALMAVITWQLGRVAICD